MEPLKVEIFEVNYSVSPGGIDEWEMNVYLPNHTAHFYGFKTAGETLEFLLEEYPTQEFNINIKSLEWYYANEERVENVGV